MKRLPESVMIIAPAALITALVLVLGFLMVGPDGESAPESVPGPGAANTSSAADDESNTSPEEPGETGAPGSTDDGGTADTEKGTADPGSPKGAQDGPERPKGKLTAPQVTLKRKPRIKVTPEATFQISSFNLLGHSHTEKGGHKAKLASGPVRMGQQLQLLDAHGVDVAGLQELQPPQWQVLNNHSGTWEAFPGGADRMSMPNSIIWRRAVFTAVEKQTIAIPYFFGKPRNMPYVLLEHNETGQRFWVGNFHNPANAHGNAARWRAEAQRLEIALANRLENETGHPVFFTGDMNDFRGYFCAITGQTSLRAANGGSNSGACQPPSRFYVDWIFGSSDVTFSNFIDDRSAAVSRTTDHPMLVATATLPEIRERIKRKN